MHILSRAVLAAVCFATSPALPAWGQAGSATRSVSGTMASSIDLADSMSQEGSGTSWMPRTSPTYGAMWMLGRNMRDMLMAHGDIHVRYTDVGSLRGDRRFDAPNWFMGMYSHPLGSNDQIGLHGMFSLDALTEGGRGYPLLFQTGETWHGNPLHDRQHPHDMEAELSATYSRRASDRLSGYLYLGFPGEPALGPPAYMHRLIAYDLADAPIGHHWQDATHITWGVATAGLNLASRVKLEGSVFNGREPDENRYLPDAARLNSYSGRLSFNPTPENALQLSYGFVTNPEGDGVNQHRITASWLYDRQLNGGSNYSSALVWGQNILPAEGRSNSLLLDQDYAWGRETVFSRIEYIRKSAGELVLSDLPPAALFDLSELTIGFVHDIIRDRGVDTGVGAAFTVNAKPRSLDAFYGSGISVSFQLFVRLRPSRLDRRASTSLPETTAKPVQERYSLSSTITPAPPRAGQKATITLSGSNADGSPMTGARIDARADMTSMSMGAVPMHFREDSPGKYAADVMFSMPGPWRIDLLIRMPGTERPLRKALTYDVAK